MSNIDTVKQMYADFKLGNIGAILERLDDKVEWDVDVPVPGVDWLQPRRGKSEVPHFFASLAPLEFVRFEPHTFFESGNMVMALVHQEAIHRASGNRYVVPYEGHLWWFNDAGLVIKYQHITDTALHQRAARGE